MLLFLYVLIHIHLHCYAALPFFDITAVKATDWNSRISNKDMLTACLQKLNSTPLQK